MNKLLSFFLLFILLVPLPTCAEKDEKIRFGGEFVYKENGEVEYVPYPDGPREMPRWEPSVGIHRFRGNEASLTGNGLPFDGMLWDGFSYLYAASIAACQIEQGMTFQSYLDRLAEVGISGEVKFGHAALNGIAINDGLQTNALQRVISADDSSLLELKSMPYHDVMTVNIGESAFICVYSAVHNPSKPGNWAFSPFNILEPALGECAKDIQDREIVYARLYVRSAYHADNEQLSWIPLYSKLASLELPMEAPWIDINRRFTPRGTEVYSLAVEEAFVIIDEQVVSPEQFAEILPFVHSKTTSTEDRTAGTHTQTGETATLTAQHIPVVRDETDESMGLYAALISAQELCQGMTFHDYAQQLARMGITGAVEFCHTECFQQYDESEAARKYVQQLAHINKERLWELYPPELYHDAMVIHFSPSVLLALYGSSHKPVITGELGFDMQSAFVPALTSCTENLWGQEICFARLFMLSPYHVADGDLPWAPPFIEYIDFDVPMTLQWQGLPNQKSYSLTAEEAFTLLEEKLIDYDVLPPSYRDWADKYAQP